MTPTVWNTLFSWFYYAYIIHVTVLKGHFLFLPKKMNGKSHISCINFWYSKILFKILISINFENSGRQGQLFIMKFIHWWPYLFGQTFVSQRARVLWHQTSLAWPDHFFPLYHWIGRRRQNSRKDFFSNQLLL